jgi:hypothetical protein
MGDNYGAVVVTGEDTYGINRVVKGADGICLPPHDASESL